MRTGSGNVGDVWLGVGDVWRGVGDVWLGVGEWDVWLGVGDVWLGVGDVCLAVFFYMKIDILYDYNVLIICVLHDPTTVQVR